MSQPGNRLLEAVAAIKLAISAVHSGNAEEADLIAKAILVAASRGEIPHLKFERSAT